jgi:hypothetical protein
MRHPQGSTRLSACLDVHCQSGRAEGPHCKRCRKNEGNLHQQHFLWHQCQWLLTLCRSMPAHPIPLSGHSDGRHSLIWLSFFLVALTKFPLAKALLIFLLKNDQDTEHVNDRAYHQWNMDQNLSLASLFLSLQRKGCSICPCQKS